MISASVKYNKGDARQTPVGRADTPFQKGAKAKAKKKDLTTKGTKEKTEIRGLVV